MNVPSMNTQFFKNCKLFWHKIHVITSKCNASKALLLTYPIKDDKGNIILDNQKKANLLASHLEKAFTVPVGPEFNSSFKRGLKHLFRNIRKS